MGRAVWWLFLILWMAYSPLARADSAKGPLAVSNPFPPHCIFLTPLPESPLILDPGGLSAHMALDYASLFVYEQSADWLAVADMEISRLELGLEYGLSHHLNIGLRVPLVSMNKGFLDGFLNDYHQAFDFANYGREQRGENQFAYVLQKEGQPLFSPESGGLHLADGELSLKLALADERETGYLTAALRYRLKLPLGDSDRWLGSGKLDHEIALLSRFRHQHWRVYLAPGITFLSDPQTRGPAVSAHTVLSFFAGGEYVQNRRWSWLAQLQYSSSPLEKTGLPYLDGDALALDLGFVYQIRPWLGLTVAFSEDLNGAFPDFNLHAGFRYTFLP